MKAHMRVLPALILALALLGSLIRPFQPAATALTIQAHLTIFSGTVTCTLQDSFTHVTTVGNETQTDELTEQATATFTLVASESVVNGQTVAVGNTIEFSASYSYQRQKVASTPASAEGAPTRLTSQEQIEGSYSGSTGQQDAFAGVEQNVPYPLSLSHPEIPATLTSSSSFESGGHTSSSAPVSSPDPIDYPDPRTRLPELTVTDKGAPLEGTVETPVHDSVTDAVDGEESCTVDLVLVVFDGILVLSGTSGGPVNDTPTVTANPPGEPNPCQVYSGPAYTEPPVSPISDFGSAAPAAPHGRGRTAAAAASPIGWSRSPKLTWADFRGHVPSTSKWDASTSSGLGGWFSHPAYTSSPCPTGGLQTTIVYRLGSAHAVFYPGTSWVRPSFSQKPADSASVWLLNHEQRHFDISEVYSRRLNTRLCSLVAPTVKPPCTGGISHTFTCAQWAGCMQQVQELDDRLHEAVVSASNDLDQKQDAYDSDTNHSRNETQQKKWNDKIDGWLDGTSDPGSAP